jgi:hypothetical protein
MVQQMQQPVLRIEVAAVAVIQEQVPPEVEVRVFLF